MDVFKKNNITKEEFEKIERKVLSKMQKLFSEVQDAITQLNKTDELKFLESTICMTFVFSDSMSRFYELFNPPLKENFFGQIFRRFFCISKKNSKLRFVNWLEKFVLNHDNGVYLTMKDSINCDLDFVWKLRNSLIHFYGLPKYKKQNPVILVNGEWRNDFGRDFINKFKQKGINLKLVNIIALREAMLNGILCFLNYLKEILKKDPIKYIDGILRINNIIQTESTEKIYINKLKP